ncbi:hypothetical protein [Alcanivorax sp. S71-1-4]|uniref:hypothetical protein n=1 Tax=Alcanivorax sp. S71-1-4 TaxID=1177159 RepID=UPI001356E6A0|nr:hypothetical protein [Alcanivorax sp. S71-1-4]
MMLKKLSVIWGLVVIALSFPNVVIAAPPSSQLIKNVKLKSVALYDQGGYRIAEVHFEPSSPVSTGCAPTDQLNLVSYWRTTEHTVNFALRVSHWMAALSSGASVDIILEGTACNTSASIPNEGGPSGMGRMFSGMRVYAD